MDKIINHSSNIPMYKQVSKIISRQIEDKKYKEGDKISSEANFMKEFGVSRITVRAAISELVEDGILVRTQGKGTFVAPPKELYKANDIVGFTRSCVLAGKTPATSLISAGMAYPTLQDIDFFGVKETDKIVYTKRLRLVDGEPTMIETNHFPPSFSFLLEENLEGSLFELLGNKHNIFVKESTRTLEVCFPTKEEMNTLGIKKNTPLLLFEDKQKDEKSAPLFISKQVYCTERLKFYL